MSPPCDSTEIAKSSSSKKRKHEDGEERVQTKKKDKSSKRRKADAQTTMTDEATSATGAKQETETAPMKTATPVEVPGVDETEEVMKTKKKKSKKENKGEEAPVPAAPSAANQEVDTARAEIVEPIEALENTGPGAEKKKTKKKLKKNKKEGEAMETPATDATVLPGAQEKKSEDGPVVAPESIEEAAVTQAEEPMTKKNDRFIVFIGNLPYTATTESVTEHFAKIKPSSVRHLTQKGTTKSKGYAFLEFDAYDRMRTCLKLFHHSDFDDGKSPARKINVELTAGGGGSKSEDRKEKLKAKNVKLNEQRQRRAEEEEKQKKRKEAKEAKKKGSVGAAETPVVEPPQPDDAGMHPSRRALLETR